MSASLNIGDKINLGRYETLDEAVSAREQGEIKYYGFVKGS